MPSLNTGNAILSNPIKVETTAYNVGIGAAASSSFKLQVTGTTNLTGALTGTSATFSGDLAVDTNTLYVDSTNNRVGIGTVGSSGYLLDVFGTATFGASTTIGNKVHIGSGAVPAGAAGIGLWATGSNLFSIVGFGDMTIDSRGSFLLINPNGGNVGISTSSPSQKLEVAGIIRGEAVNVYGSTDPASTSPYLFSPTLGALGFGGNGSEKMRITSGGNVLVGTTSDNGEKFQVNGITRTSEAFRQDTGSVSMASNTATTIYSLGGIRGLYIIYVSLPAGDASPVNYSAYAIISWDTGNGRILQQTDGSNLFITLSGSNNVQARQTSGAPQNVVYRLIKIG